MLCWGGELARYCGGNATGDQAVNQDETISEEDALLRRRLREGDRLAFEQAVKGLGPRLLAQARRIVGDSAAAEDVVQDAFTKLWTQRTGLRAEGGSVLPWLRRVTTNMALNHCEKRRVRSRPIPDAPMEIMDDPHEAVEGSETRGRVEAAMARLSPERRAVLGLRVFEDMSYAEIGEVLSIAPGTVMSRLHRARLELRRMLSALDPTPDNPGRAGSEYEQASTTRAEEAGS